MVTGQKAEGRRQIFWWMVMVLLTAVVLRFYHLASIPPGLTHDEADHGITAWRIVADRVRDVYFTIGYGREPLYDYVTAVVMRVIGPTYLAGRLVSAYAGVLLVAGMYRWAKDAFNAPIALFTAAGIAISFWPVATSRQMLRSELLPLFFVLALVWYWKGIKKFNAKAHRSKGTKKEKDSSLIIYHSSFFFIAGLFLGFTFYTYIPSRVMWGVFPALLLYLMMVDRDLLQKVWRPTAVTLIVAFIVGIPLWQYLLTHPTTEVRIDELSAPLTAVAQGNLQPLLTNILDGIKTISFVGDWSVRYNIPDMPFLPPVMSFLFIIGLLIALWHTLRPRTNHSSFTIHRSSFFIAITWFIAGLSPILVTGREWSFTQAIGMQPVLYLFPALAISDVASRISGRFRNSQFAIQTGVFVLFLGIATQTYVNYFERWANDPAVRVQYESTMMTAMAWITEYGSGATAVSTITPDPYHTPALAQMTMHNENANLHWFDARGSLLLPSAPQSTIIIPGFTPIPEAMADYWTTAVAHEVIPLRQTDADRPLTIYHVDRDQMLIDWQTQIIGIDGLNFGDAATLIAYDLSQNEARPGDVVAMTTWWEVQRPLPDALIFTHIQGQNGVPIAQADQIHVPGATWQTGDIFIQLHQITIPNDAVAGDYPIAVGLCQRTSDGCLRQPIINQTGDIAPLTTLTIIEP